MAAGRYTSQATSMGERPSLAIRLASFALVVVLPAPCSPTIRTLKGLSSLNRVVPSPNNLTSSSWMIFTTCWPGETDLSTSCPRQAFFTSSTNSLAVRKCTSAESRALRTSPSASLTFSSESLPTPRKLRRVLPNLSLSESNISRDHHVIAGGLGEAINPRLLSSLPFTTNWA